LNDHEYTFLKVKILKLTRINLDSYKTQQMRRRLDGLIARSQAQGIIPYCKLLEEDQGALGKLRDFLTINVSEFYRDSAQFGLLKSRIIPELLRRSPVLNIWSAGCSMGAEPYSIAMMLEQLSPRVKHKIVATDLDENILAKARAGGPYSSADVKNVDRKLLLERFTATPEGYWARDGLKRKVVFRTQNLLSDPFDQGFDLIVCRNVVIYFSDEAKTKLNRGFYRSLKNNGVLLIGGAETLLDAQELGFERMCTSYYQKSTRSMPQRAVAA
jgi:chemotaxis protein methyltransferase CheR